jgi:hypothetical protein
LSRSRKSEINNFGRDLAGILGNIRERRIFAVLLLSENFRKIEKLFSHKMRFFVR